MKTYYSLSAIVMVILLNAGLSFADTGKSLTIYGRQYYNGQTVYIDCTVTSVLVETDYTPATPSSRPLVNTWNASSNYSLQPVFGTDVNNSGSVYLVLDQNRNDGFIRANFFQGNDVITVYVTQRATPTLTVTPTLCSAGQSGDFSTTLNFYGSSTANVVWETTGGLTVNGSSSYRVIDNTISRATVQHNSYGTLTVYGEIPGCNNMRTNSVTQHIGTPSASDLTFRANPDPGFQLCSNTAHSFAATLNLPANLYRYDWSVPIGSASLNYFYGSGPNATVSSSSPGGGFVLQLNTTNLACNTTGTTSRTFQISNCNGSFRVASNPSSDNVTAIFEPVDDSNYLPSSVRLSHEKNGVVKEVNVREKFSKENAKTGLRINFDVTNLPKDTYYLQGVYENGTVQSERIIVQ